MRGRISSFSRKLLEFDPLCSKLFTNRPFLTALCVSIIQLNIWWFFGKWTVANYTTPNIVAPTDPDEMSFAIFLWGIFLPVFWWFYLSLPRLWTRVMVALTKEEVVDSDSFSSAITPHLKPTYFLPSSLISLGILILYFVISVPDEMNLGRTSFWFVTTAGKIIEGTYVWVNAAVLISFVLRTLILILVMRNYFYKKGIKVIHVYHIDKCGGFASVGNLAMIISSLAVAAGVWVTWYMLLPLTGGGDFHFDLTYVLLYIAYIVVVPLLLISLIRPVSLAMKRYKQEIVMQVSRKLQDELKILMNKSTNSEPMDAVLSVLQKMEEYQKLSSLYDHLSAMPESPIRAINLKRFSGVASIPLLVGVVSFIADIFQIFTGLEK